MTTRTALIHLALSVAALLAGVALLAAGTAWGSEGLAGAGTLAVLWGAGGACWYGWAVLRGRVHAPQHAERRYAERVEEA